MYEFITKDIFFRSIPRSANLGKSRDRVLAFMFADLRQRLIARDQSDLPFDHIDHVVISVCYLMGTIWKIKYVKAVLRGNLSCLIREQL